MNKSIHFFLLSTALMIHSMSYAPGNSHPENRNDYSSFMAFCTGITVTIQVLTIALPHIRDNLEYYFSYENYARRHEEFEREKKMRLELIECDLSTKKDPDYHKKEIKKLELEITREHLMLEQHRIGNEDNKIKLILKEQTIQDNKLKLTRKELKLLLQFQQSIALIKSSEKQEKAQKEFDEKFTKLALRDFS